MRIVFVDATPSLSAVIERLHRVDDPPLGLPCLSLSSATEDVVYAFGHGHVGLAASARSGRVVAQLLAGGKPGIPVAPFGPRRFRHLSHSWRLS